MWIARATIYSNGAVAILSDIFLAATPISFLKNVRRSVRERAILIFLMGLGVFAAIATGVKMTLVAPFGNRGDRLWDSIDIVTWSCVEAYMGIIAASVPCLKSPFEAVLRRVGVIKSGGGGSSRGSEGSGSFHYDLTRSDGSSSYKHDRNYRLSGILIGDRTMRDVITKPTASLSEQSILGRGSERGCMREDV